MNASYIAPEKTHDYSFDWDYTIDENVSEAFAASTQDIASQLREDLLPELQAFADFTIGFITADSAKERLAIYIDSTSSHPYVALCEKTITDAATQYDVDMQTAIETSIAHELGHALQQLLGMKTSTPAAEEQAEAFAYQWHYDRQILSAFEKRLHTPSQKDRS